MDLVNNSNSIRLNCCDLDSYIAYHYVYFFFIVLMVIMIIRNHICFFYEGIFKYIQLYKFKIVAQ